jgi:hypothetical protein
VLRPAARTRAWTRSHAAGQPARRIACCSAAICCDSSPSARLAAGGEGETWLCKEKDTGREVAIKLVRRPIPKSITQIIQREIRILADLGGAWQGPLLAFAGSTLLNGLGQHGCGDSSR